MNIKVIPIKCPCGTNTKPSPSTVELHCRCGRIYRAKLKSIHYFEEVTNENQP